MFALALVLQLLVALYGIAQEVRWGHYGFHTGEYGSAALHTRLHGTFVLSTAPDWVVPTRAQLNFHHPYLLHQYIAASQALFGEKPWVLRLPNVLFAFAALCGVWSLLRRARDEQTAALGALFFVLNPLHGCYCFLPEYQLCAFTWVLWGGVGWLETLRAPRAWSVALFLLCAALAGLTDWPWYPVAFFLFLSFAWQLRPGGALALEHAQAPRKLLALRATLAAFALVVLTTFTQHLLMARWQGEFGQATGSFLHRAGGMHVRVLVPLLLQRFGLLHATVLPLLAVRWLYDTARTRRGDALTLYLGSVLLGAILDTSIFRWGFAFHEYRTYWYVPAFAFIAAESVLRFAPWLAARAEKGLAPAVFRTRALALTAGGLALVLFAFYVPMVALCRARGGSVTMSNYSEHLSDMLLARVARLRRVPGSAVAVGSTLDGRLEVRWLLDGPHSVIRSSFDVRELYPHGSVLALDRSGPFEGDPSWTPLVARGHLLVVDGDALLVTTAEGDASVEVAHPVRRGRRSLLDAWLHASFQGPAGLEAGTPAEMERAARAVHATDEVLVRARRGHTPLLDALPRDLEGATRR